MNPLDLKTIEELVDLITPLVIERGESLRLEKDKLRKRLKYAVSHKHLVAVREEKMSGAVLIRLGHAAEWARQKFPRKGLGLPILIEARTEELKLIEYKGTIVLDPIPSDLRECQVALGAALKRIRELESQLGNRSAESHQVD